MGHGRWTRDEFADYSTKAGKSYDRTTDRVSGQTFKVLQLDKSLDPKNVVRTCVNTDEHPNTIPVILALDVTGSMGGACQETAECLGKIMTDLYGKYTDIEFMMMGIGDLAYDDAPIQASQFESDVRIAEALDKIYMEHGGGGNKYESYTAAWYFGLHHTKLDAFDKQGRKGIIITMGDEPLNPYLPFARLNEVTGDKNQADIETGELYKEASNKFDIYHIGVNDSKASFSYFKNDIAKTFGELLDNNYKIATINTLGSTICECIDDSIAKNPIGVTGGAGFSFTNSNDDGISW